MSFVWFLLLIVSYYLCGSGCLKLLRTELRPGLHWPMAIIAGMPVVSLVPCVVQLAGMPIDVMPIACGIGIITLLCSLPLLMSKEKVKFTMPAMPQLYEWPFILLVLMFICISAWRCFYYPPYARDMLSGPELLAEFAVREKTMVSSVFTVELSTTNNYFKSPFITSMQIIYKLLVSPFGQTWLTVVFVSFMALLYSLLRERTHKLLAGFFMMLFIAIPDPFAYTYIMLYDYANMVLYFCGCMMLFRFLANDKQGDLAAAAFLFGLATYVRAETLVLVVLMTGLPAWHYYRRRVSVKKAATGLGMLIGFSVLFYVLCIYAFVRNFVPFGFDAGKEIALSADRIGFFFARLGEMNTKLFFSGIGVQIYGYFIYVACFVIVCDLVLFRKYNKEALWALYSIAVIYFGMALLGAIIPLVDLLNTTKRGMFKALPLIIIYYANSPMFQRIAAALTNFELPREKEPVPAPRAQPQAPAQKKKRQ